MSYSRQPQVVLANSGVLKQTPPPTVLVPAGIIPVELDAKIATTSSLGVVQVGSGLAITPAGVLSATGGDDDCCHVHTYLTNTSYNATEDDCYIGVDSDKPTTIILPEKPKNGKIIIVKAEMKPPLGNRKVTITTADGTLIDGYQNCIIQVSNETVRLLFRDGWRII